jgi:hypothetical protein
MPQIFYDLFSAPWQRDKKKESRESRVRIQDTKILERKYTGFFKFVSPPTMNNTCKRVLLLFCHK